MNAKQILKSKPFIITISVIMVVVIALSIAAMVLLIGAKGSKNNEYWMATQEFDMENTGKLEKTAGQDYKILNLTDVQFSDTLDMFGQDKQAYDTIKKLVEEVKPDLITLTGDQVWTQYQKNSVKKFVKFMDGLKIPWAPVNGNHDGEGNVDKNWIADQYVASEYCLFQKGPNNIGGIGNYVINIMEGDKIYHSLIMMDSGASRIYLDKDGKSKSAYEFIQPAQIEWYKWVVNGLSVNNNGTMPESTLMFHIALPEYLDAYNEWEANGFDPAQGFGEKREDVYSPPVNSGFFDVIKAVGSTKNILVGHDHVNDYSVLYQGIRLSYALKTGDRCYNEDDVNGGTIITIGESVNVEHKYIKA